MKHSEIYRAAAKHVAERNPFPRGLNREGDAQWHYPCCSAIEANTPFHPGTMQRSQDRLLRPFAQHFKPANKSPYGLWFGPIEIEANRYIRVLALLFMAEIAESQGN